MASPPRSVLDRPAAEKTECRRDASSRAGDAGAGTRGGVHAWLHDRLPSLPTLLGPPAEGEPGPYRLRCSCRANCLAAPGLRYQTRASHFWECVPKGITPQACTVRVSKVPRTSFVEQIIETLPINHGTGKQCYTRAGWQTLRGHGVTCQHAQYRSVRKRASTYHLLRKILF